MEVFFHKNVTKEVNKFPPSVQKNLYEILDELKKGIVHTMPVVRKMKNVGSDVFELRVKGMDGIYRVIYFKLNKDKIFLVHGFNKKSQKTPLKNINLAKKRIKELL